MCVCCVISEFLPSLFLLKALMSVRVDSIYAPRTVIVTTQYLHTSVAVLKETVMEDVSLEIKSCSMVPRRRKDVTHAPAWYVCRVIYHYV